MLREKLLNQPIEKRWKLVCCLAVIPAVISYKVDHFFAQFVALLCMYFPSYFFRPVPKKERKKLVPTTFMDQMPPMRQFAVFAGLFFGGMALIIFVFVFKLDHLVIPWMFVGLTAFFWLLFAWYGYKMELLFRSANLPPH